MHGQYLQKLTYLAQQFSDSTINAKVLRKIWQEKFHGQVWKGKRYLYRKEIISQLAQHLVVQHGSYGQ
eukprot:6102980-Karenia_brevis.AAC.1